MKLINTTLLIALIVFFFSCKKEKSIEKLHTNNAIISMILSQETNNNFVNFSIASDSLQDKKYMLIISVPEEEADQLFLENWNEERSFHTMEEATELYNEIKNIKKDDFELWLTPIDSTGLGKLYYK